MVTAASRGWGTGWPDCQRDACVWINAGGIRLLVRAEVAPIFKGFCDELVQRGYPLGDVADDWGFACRSIRGSTAPSNHSWGLAIDLNATTNPMTSNLVTDFPKWAVELGEKKYGLHWGGRYVTRPDAMHWEWLGTPAQAAWLIAALAALPAAEQPPEPVPQEDPDMARILQHPNGTQAIVGPGAAMTILHTTTETEALMGAGTITGEPIVLADTLIWDTVARVAQRAHQFTVDLDVDDDQRIIDAIPPVVLEAVKRAMREGTG